MHLTFLIPLVYTLQAGLGEGGMSAALWAFAEFFLVFTSVALHELGHSFTARYFGVGVSGILLTPVGGIAQFDHIPRRPLHEFLITVAGPAVNFAIVAALWFFVSMPEGWDKGYGPLALADLGRFLLRDNLILGLFNLFPAFPMDGGRILRATLATRMTYLRATFWAVNIARVLTVLGIGFGLWTQSYNLVAVFFVILIVGNMEYRAVKRQEDLAAALRELYARPVDPQPPEPPILDSYGNGPN